MNNEKCVDARPSTRLRLSLSSLRDRCRERLSPIIAAVTVVLATGLASGPVAQAAPTAAAKQPVSKTSSTKAKPLARSTAKPAARTASKSGSRSTARQASGSTAKGSARSASKTSLAGAKASGRAARGETAVRKRVAKRDARRNQAGNGSREGAVAARAASVRRVSHMPAPTPSIGQAIGLQNVYDPLALRSSVALVLDASTGQVLFEKNTHAVLPIASITKLMTAMVVLDGDPSLDEVLQITGDDIDTEKFTRSRLRVGTKLSRDEMLNLALMSSENRAANALGRHYPGGLQLFVRRMNEKAHELGMVDTHFVEPTGLSSANVSTAVDLAKLVVAASKYPLIREYSTAPSRAVEVGARLADFRNTNRLLKRSDWEIGLQKTGYISEAGNCLVMRTSIEGRPIVLVLLDADGSLSRFGDAERIRGWLEAGPRPDGMQRALAQPSRGS